MSKLSARERVQRLLAGEDVDRPPFTFWRHWPGDDQDAAAHVAAEVRHRDTYGLDLVKLTPSASYLAEAWGARTTYRGDPLGVRDYDRRPVRAPEDWSAVTERAVEEAPSLLREVETVRLARARLGPEVPILPTVFSPLSVARYLAGEELLGEHVREWRASVAAALEAITRTTLALVDRLIAAGADGIYLSLFPASHRLFDAETYAQLTLRHDQRVLEAAAGGWLRVVHFHLPEPLLELAPHLPTEAVSWEHTGPGPSLAAGSAVVRRPVMGGVDQTEVLAAGTPDDVRAAVGRAHAEAGGRVLLAPACSYPLATPEANLHAFADEVRGLGQGLR